MSTVPLPSLCEQRRIAEILDVMDDQIRLTTERKIVEKLQDLRESACVSTLLSVVRRTLEAAGLSSRELRYLAGDPSEGSLGKLRGL